MSEQNFTPAYIYIESQTLYKVHAVNIYTEKETPPSNRPLQFVLTKETQRSQGASDHKNAT